MFKKRTHNLLYVATIFLVGILLGQTLLKKNSAARVESSKISTILQYIMTDYVDSVALNQMEERAIEEMISTLDPHSSYISKEDYHAMNDPLLGKFDGIGVQFRMVEDSVVVIMPLENGPSKKAGILAGDRIVIADADTLAGKKYNSIDIQERLKGERGSLVTLLVK